MEWLDDAVLEVTRKYEAAVPWELFHEVTQSRLSAIGIKIVSFVKNDILSLPTERHGRGEVEDLVSQRVDVAVHTAVDHDVVTLELLEHGPSNGSLADTRGAGQ